MRRRCGVVGCTHTAVDARLGQDQLLADAVLAVRLRDGAVDVDPRVRVPLCKHQQPHVNPTCVYLELPHTDSHSFFVVCNVSGAQVMAVYLYIVYHHTPHSNDGSAWRHFIVSLYYVAALCTVDLALCVLHHIRLRMSKVLVVGHAGTRYLPVFVFICLCLCFWCPERDLLSSSTAAALCWGCTPCPSLIRCCCRSCRVGRCVGRVRATRGSGGVRNGVPDSGRAVLDRPLVCCGVSDVRGLRHRRSRRFGGGSVPSAVHARRSGHGGAVSRAAAHLAVAIVQRLRRGKVPFPLTWCQLVSVCVCVCMYVCVCVRVRLGASACICGG